MIESVYSEIYKNFTLSSTTGNDLSVRFKTDGSTSDEVVTKTAVVKPVSNEQCSCDCVHLTHDGGTQEYPSISGFIESVINEIV